MKVRVKLINPHQKEGEWTVQMKKKMRKGMGINI
jgi:hypothetical protein